MNRLIIPFLCAYAVSRCFSQSSNSDVADGSVVRDAVELRKFYKVDLNKLLPIPDADTLTALRAHTNCGRVKERPIITLTQQQQAGFQIGEEHPRLRLMKESVPTETAPHTTVTITLPDGWVLDDYCVHPWKYSVQKFRGFRANMTPTLDQRSHRQSVIFETIKGGGVCQIFIRPADSKPVYGNGH